MERILLPIVLSALTLVWGGYPRGLDVFPTTQQNTAIESHAEARGGHETKKQADPITVWVTAYSSTPEETDDTPFITAYGTEVRDGIIASNFLPFGTHVQIPKLFGDRVFVVEDRMHKRKSGFIDVWMPSKEAAQEFGIHQTEIVVVDHENVLALAR